MPIVSVVPDLWGFVLFVSSVIKVKHVGLGSVL